MLRAILVLLALCVLVACDASPAAPEAAPAPTGGGRPLKVVATTGMIADPARVIAGDRAVVTTLIAPGIDPHLYKPTRSDVQRLLNADVILTNGLLLEGRMGDALARASAAGRSVRAVAELVDPALRLAAAEEGKAHDPHLWMDPAAWAHVVEVIRDVLIEADPDGAETYRRNCAAYVADLDALDAYAKAQLGAIPPDRRVLVTAHDAFRYFGRRYDLTVLGVQGISTESEAGLQDIERLVSLLVERRVPAVFAESTVSDRSVQALVAGARARGHAVALGPSLYSDAMGDVDTYEGTYIGMIDHNVTTIARALGGSPPERGMRGKLAP
jgi:manganese/zinc/iron transport system substrate-binding protein